ncbi:cobalt-precorrin-6A reductase [Sedimentitalea sp. HM32M-2]|uniref:cobalt-precorrin-6A reductase n=1 Tax=Sedimentitalea sp. HM32M-2 TaxID=3351566 RepID=UPI003630F829
MQPNLLILGGTTEATALARLVAQAGLQAVYSYAGRVDRPRDQPVPVRVGGFGGVEGLAAYLRAGKISHVVDATHPFAAQMSRHAIEACEQTGVPLLALSRPPWQAETGDRWTVVPDLAGAVAALKGAPRRVFLAVGRLHLADFAARPQHHYLLRLIDRPATLPLPDCTVIVARGPFATADDKGLMQKHDIDLVVSKNAGGTGARAKIDAARALGLPVLMVDRPAIPPRDTVATPGQVMRWLVHCGVNLGV